METVRKAKQACQISLSRSEENNVEDDWLALSDLHSSSMKALVFDASVNQALEFANELLKPSRSHEGIIFHTL